MGGGGRGPKGGIQTPQLLDFGVVIAPLLRLLALIASKSWHNKLLILWNLVWCVRRASSDKSGKIDFVIVPKRLLKAEERSKMG